MAGLMEKDLRLILQRKSAYLLIFAISVLMSVSVEGTFVIGYLVFLGAIAASSTISYDEYDNGYLFLMTLPVDARIYVAEKYIFCLLSGMFSWIVGVVVYFGSHIAVGTLENGKEALEISITFLPVMFFLVAVMIPFLLKYGAEKGRIVMVVICGGIAAVGMLAGKVLQQAGDVVKPLIHIMDKFPDSVYMLLLTAFCICALGISYLCSRHIMEHKQF